MIRSTRLSMPALLVCERASARQDRICTRTFDITQANATRDTYMSLNETLLNTNVDSDVTHTGDVGVYFPSGARDWVIYYYYIFGTKL